ncbi:MAG: fumarylacetoacetate hydrolase family protein [Candidatus Omnitrophica bacterium]|nr:fumarylacetoacetate hydrolase family protein [Candidatus Omnitrophota bacterium]
MIENGSRLFKSDGGLVLVTPDGVAHSVGVEWDRIFQSESPLSFIANHLGEETDPGIAIAPIGGQEVWAAGVTYYRSRDARMEESETAGGGDFYDRVYSAERPELFFKATPHRVRGPNEPVRIRHDSKWNVPEPELTLAVNAHGKIFGYTIGNDMSSRDIEGQNPLYLPQAKTYDGCCALGPSVYLSEDPLPSSTEIDLRILRGESVLFEGTATLNQMKRTPVELVEFLYRENSFPKGCFLMTGTGIVPESDFTLQRGDEIRIRIDPIGTLMNPVSD